MWKFFQANKSGDPLEICNGLCDNPTLVTESGKTINAHWKSSDITTATTTTVIEVPPNQSILLTDLVVILTKKVASSTIIPRFSDGTNTVNLLTFEGENDAIHFSHAFQRPRGSLLHGAVRGLFRTTHRSCHGFRCH